MSWMKAYLAMMNSLGIIQNQLAHINLPNYPAELAIINSYRPYFPLAQKIADRYKGINQVIYPEVYQSIKKSLDVSLNVESSFQFNKHMLQAMNNYDITIKNLHLPMERTLQNLQRNHVTFQQLANYYSSLQNEFITDDEAENKEKIDEKLSTENQQEIINTVQNIMNSEPQNWVDKTKEKYYSLEKTHPIIAKAVIGLLIFILQYFLTKAFDLTGEAINRAFVRENPTPTSQVITVVEQKQQVFILDDQPYYYEIKFTDEQTGKIYKGWISKRSIQQAKDEEDSSDVGDK